MGVVFSSFDELISTCGYAQTGDNSLIIQTARQVGCYHRLQFSLAMQGQTKSSSTEMIIRNFFRKTGRKYQIENGIFLASTKII